MSNKTTKKSELIARLTGTPWVVVTTVKPENELAVINLDQSWTMIQLSDDKHSFTRIMVPSFAAVAVPSLKPGTPPMVPHSVYGYLDVTETYEEIFAQRYPLYGKTN